MLPGHVRDLAAVFSDRGECVDFKQSEALLSLPGPLQ